MVNTARRPTLDELLRFPLQGEDWQNRLLIGTGLLLGSFILPFVPALFVYGYLIRIMKEAIDEGELTLPAWEDWGGLLRGGSRAFVIGFTYLLPGMAVMLCGTCLYCAFSLMPSLSTGGPGSTGSSDDVFAAFFILAMFVFFFSFAVGTFLSLLGAIPMPVAAAQMADERRLGAAYRLRHLVRSLTANPLGYFSAWVVFFGLMGMNYALMMLAYYTLVLACLIPILLTPFSLYAMVVAAGQFGLAYRESKRRLEEAGAASA